LPISLGTQCYVSGTEISAVLKVALSLNGKWGVAVAMTTSLGTEQSLEHGDLLLMDGSPATAQLYVASIVQIFASNALFECRRNINAGTT